MSDDIPPLIPETPPPMTKLDWEDDEDFMDYPHLALEMPSESSLSPDGGWNPIEELSLPFDGDVDNKPRDCIKSNTIDSSSNWTSGIVKNDQPLESSLSEQEPSLHTNNSSIWKDKENFVPWENKKELTSDHSCSNDNELDCKTEIKNNVSSENVIDSSRKINDDDSFATPEQYNCEVENEKNNVTTPIVKFKFNNSEELEQNEIVQPKIDEKSFSKETLLNGHLEPVDTKELSENTNCVQNVLLDNFKNDISVNDTAIISPDEKNGILSNDLSINNNNIVICINDQEEYTDFCDFETAMPDSLNVPLPNRTLNKNSELIDKFKSFNENHNSDQIPVTPLINEAGNVYSPVEEKMEQKVDSINLSCSKFQNQEINENDYEDNIDSEFDEFCDFHAFSTSTTENKSDSVTNDDFCDFETNVPIFNDTIQFKHSNLEQVKSLTSNDNNNDLTVKSDNQNNLNSIDVDEDDDNFCDFESSYSVPSFPKSHQVSDVKQNYEVINPESQHHIDYKEFCKDTFKGDYALSEEIDLQNLDHELNESQVWQNLKDVESSPALNYNWSKSKSNSVFLSSLSIDSRNILYGASWNPKVPRFAANMSNSPLEPLKACNNDAIDTKISQTFSNGSFQERVPDPEFDWKSSGLINPLDCNHTSLLDLELLDTLAPCCTNTLQPQTWKTSETVKEDSVKEDEVYVQSSPESVDVFDEFFGASLPSSDNQSVDTNESPSTTMPTLSPEAQRILDSLPDYEVLQKPYLVILEKENNNLFLN